MAYPSLALHTLTTKPWSIFECIDQYTRRGIGGISVWRETVADHDPAEVRKALVGTKSCMRRAGLHQRGQRSSAALVGT